MAMLYTRVSFVIIYKTIKPMDAGEGDNTIWHCVSNDKIYLSSQSSSGVSYFLASFVFSSFYFFAKEIEANGTLHFPAGSFHDASRVSSIKHPSQYILSVDPLFPFF